MKIETIILVGIICLFITVNIYFMTDKKVEIEYRDKIIEKECLINCSKNNNTINCELPSSKNLTIKKIETYITELK